MIQTALCHELTTTAGKVEMAYAGSKPWHGLGTLIPDNATPDEMRVAAGMDWEIKRAKPMFIHTEWPKSAEMADTGVAFVPGRSVLYRSDTNAPLSIVSDRFHEIQPREAIEFFRDMVEAGGFTMETAGTMQGGKRLWCMVKTGAGFSIGEDEVTARLLFATACDGTLATSVRQTAIRVVCKNTFNAAIHGNIRAVTVRHNTVFKAELVKKRLVDISDAFAGFAKTAELLAKTRVNATAAEAMLKALLPVPFNGLVEDSRGYKTILALFNGNGAGSLLPSANGTAWGLFNAVTEYADHHSRSRNEETRADAALFGSGDRLKSAAWDLVTA